MTPEDERTDLDEAKALLARLAGDGEATIVARAEAATESLESAAAFVDDGGIEALEGAIEAVDDAVLQARGEDALAAFRRFRAAADGEFDPNHFHSGRDTDLRCGAESSAE